MVPHRMAGMMSYQVLATIFAGKAKRLASAFGIRETSAAKFLRDPDGSGVSNPLDRLCRVFDEAVLANRSQSHLLIEYLREYHARLLWDRRFADWSKQSAATAILTSGTEAVRVLALANSAPDEILRALVEARSALDEAILAMTQEDG